MRALGVHVFAGGFTRGVMRRAKVVAQLEIHGLGRHTVEKMGVPFVQTPDWREWPAYDDVQLVYGNPRCTGFSCLTTNLGEAAHGPWAKQTADIHDLCSYAVSREVGVVVWESVQQAYSIGRPLLDWLRDELFAPAGYRIAHVFVCAASFGNAQTRRRYFFVAYRGCNNFNVEAPELPRRHATVRDVIGDMLGRKTHPVTFRDESAAYDADSYLRLNAREVAVVPHLAPRVGLNRFARLYPDKLSRICPRYGEIWANRTSARPFGLHCISRIAWDYRCPSLYSSCGRLIHPELDRPLTVGELSALMGWGGAIPSGPQPVQQIAKGVVPDVGAWLTRQVELYLADDWGADDWSTRYDPRRGYWVGEKHVNKPLEKVLDLTHYYPAIKEIGT